MPFCSQIIAFTRFSENITSELQAEVTDIRTHPRFLADAPMVSIEPPMKLLRHIILELSHLQIEVSMLSSGVMTTPPISLLTVEG